MGSAIQLGDQWFWLQPDGTRLGPFPDEAAATASGMGVASGGAPVDVGGAVQGAPSADTSRFIQAPNGQWLAPHYDIAGNVTGYTPLSSSEDLIRQAELARLQAETSRAYAGAQGTTASAALLGHQLAAQTAAQQLAEQQRQFNEQFGSDKAKFNIQQQLAEANQRFSQAANTRDFAAAQYWRDRADQLSRMQFGEGQRQFDASQALEQQRTLLGLGSRPDTLIRYLYALRGQQAPQGLGVPPALPGFQNVQGVSSGALPTYYSPSAAGAAPAPSSPSPAAAPTARISPIIEQAPQNAPPIGPVPSGGLRDPGAINALAGFPGYFGPNDVNKPKSLAIQTPSFDLTAAGAAKRAGASYAYAGPAVDIPQPAGATGLSASGALAPLAQANASYAGLGQDQLREIDLRRAAAARREENGFAKGGVIPEPVMGMGMRSGQPYMLGEESMQPGHREVVVPEKKVPEDIFQRLMRDAQKVDYSETKDGQRRVKVERRAQGGILGYNYQDPSVFNPPKIGNDFNLPQIGNLTGGTSLVPSAQRLFDALPSERDLFSGYLRDEAGVQPQDVFEMARRLAPQAANLRAGRFVN